MDEKGHKIGAIVSSCDSNKWSNQLNEGEIYIMQNFEIEKNIGQYKVSKHPFKLLFTKGTIVKEQQIPNIPPNIYEFISFEDILSGKASPDVLVDVIGQFVDIKQDQQHKGKRKLVIIMRDQGLDSIPICESFSQGISQFSQATQSVTVDKFCINAEVKSVKEINEVDRDVYYVTVAKIDKFFVANGWKYDRCSKCNTRGDPATPYICRGCGKNVTETIIRYKLEVQVSHQKECAKFVLWDKQCVQLLGDGELDPMTFPEAIDGILGKTLAFKVKVQPTYGKSSVKQISDDAQIIESILGNLPIHKDPIISCNKGKSVLDVADLNDSQSFSATTDYDPDLLGQLTPVKRQSLEEQLDDQGSQYLQSCQLSSNKLTKIIKTE
ncbi:Nucleic acid-binding, OB-fold [Sesbania bispinosa]|nr:Nucleic acid-binding, OB-fold [Sesbania bispinosa]